MILPDSIISMIYSLYEYLIDIVIAEMQATKKRPRWSKFFYTLTITAVGAMVVNPIMLLSVVFQPIPTGHKLNEFLKESDKFVN